MKHPPPPTLAFLSTNLGEGEDGPFCLDLKPQSAVVACVVVAKRAFLNYCVLDSSFVKQVLLVPRIRSSQDSDWHIVTKLVLLLVP